MLRIYTCLSQHHNPWLVVLAGFICFLCSLTAFNVISRARHARADRMRHLWLVTAAFVIGFGIWATHFVAMLAFDPGLPIAYDLDLTLVSIALAILITGAGIAAYVWWPTRLGALAGGITVGLGITCMHYTGMAAVRLSGYITYDLDLVIASILLGTVLAALAFLTKNHLGGAKGALAGTGLLTLAICGMHFTAMAAASLVAMNTGPLPASSLSNGWLATAISAAALTVIILCLATSLLDQHLARRALDESVRLRTLAEAGTEGIVICSDGLIVHSNSNFTRFTGLTLAALTGRPIIDFIGADAYERALDNMERNASQPFEAALASGQDISIPVEIVARRMVTGKDARQVFALRDLTEHKRSQARIEHLAHYDALTALSNRLHLERQIAHDIALATRMDAKLAVLCLNLDRFKAVNDTLGHQAGDLLLQGVAQRLTDIVRETDTVARLGSDEFAILQVGISQPDGATRLAQRILQALEKPFLLDGAETAVSVSMGIATFPEDGASPMALLRTADIALSRAKTEGRKCFRFYKPGMDEAVLLRHALESDLKRSVRNGEMFLEYQPQADTATGRITGFEALVRWQHPRHGRLGPEAFIEVAEECGYIVEIGEWVLEQACRDAATWEQPLNIAVNLSPIQFQRTDLVACVGSVLKRTGLAPERLELEITEGVLLADRKGATLTLSRLKKLGVGIAMDDFGTGYSSLSYLQSFPFDKIKIDRSFVADLDDNGDARAIVNAVIGLSQSLHLPVIAEGVEHPSQLEFLRLAGCDEVQGYLIGKPAAIGSFAELTGRRLKFANDA